MRNPATYRRGAAAVCLVLAGVLSATFIVLATAPGWGSDGVARLQAVVDAGGTATVSFLAFAAYQLPLMIGLLGVAHLLRGRTPLLANLGATLAGVGAIGYAVYGGSQLVIPAMVADQSNLELFAQLRTDAEPLTEPFAALGMVGSVLGLLLLSIALWRAKLGPRWIPVTLWGFLAVEFAGTALSPAASGPVSAVLLLVALLSLAVLIQRSPVSAWTSAVDMPSLVEHGDEHPGAVTAG
jgi:DMSO/TMAO reductase YedYZ heme-binding membrane subunit